jgi:hypothetical protein
MTDAINLSGVTVHNSPNPALWPVTTALTRLEVRTGGVYVEFTKKDGPDRWPDVPIFHPDGSPWTNPDGSQGTIQYTFWLGMRESDGWHIAGLMEFWYGLDVNGGDITKPAPDAPDHMQIPKNWTYDCGPMARQPAPGEMVAVFVTAGSARKKDQAIVRERSEVVLIAFPWSSPATYDIGLPDVPPVVTDPPPADPPPAGITLQQLAAQVASLKEMFEAAVEQTIVAVDLMDGKAKRLAQDVEVLQQDVRALTNRPTPTLPPLPNYVATVKILGLQFPVESKPKTPWPPTD